MSKRVAIVPHGEAIIKARIEAGLNKTDIAKMANIPHSSVIRAEQGGGVRPKTAIGISKALGMDFDELFTIKTSGTDGEGAAQDSGQAQ